MSHQDITLLLSVYFLWFAALSSAIVALYKRTKHLSGALVRIVDILQHLLPPPTAISIQQLIQRPEGVYLMPITGITLGAVGTFSATPTPAGSAFPSGTTFKWTSDDAATTLTPSAEGAQVAVATSTSDTTTSFNLTCTSSTGVSGTANVPLTAPAPPTPTGIAINQLS